MIDRIFKLADHGTDARTETLAGATTFLTMAYIVFVQPAVLSGSMFGFETGLDFGAVTVATCLAAALATAIMGLYARYPIAQAPGMGENFFFVFTMLPAAAALPAVAAGETTAWQVGLGAVFVAGVIFLGLSLTRVRERILDAVSPSLKNAIAVGIGLFIAFIGLQNAGVVVADPGTAVKLTPRLASPDLAVFLCGLTVMAVLQVRRVRGALLFGIAAATGLALALHHLLPALGDWADTETVRASMLAARFAPADALVAPPPSLAPTFLKLDLVHVFTWSMIPYIVVFLCMDLFDTMGTLIGVGEQAGFIRDGRLPRARRAMVSDAVGTVAGAAMGTSTVTSFIESAAGVEQGGRTGLTALVTAALFLLALFFTPVVAMVGSYPPITAPALVIVGAMMIRNVRKIDWDDASEGIPAFLVLAGIPLTYSISDGLALGFVGYPVLKLLTGRGRELGWPLLLLSGLMLAYLVARAVA